MSQKLKGMLSQNKAESNKFLLTNVDKLQFNAEEAMLIQDLIYTGTNGI